MKKIILSAAVALVLTGCEQAEVSNIDAPVAEKSQDAEQAKTADTRPSRSNGALDLAGFDQATRPQDDFFQHVNGGWIDSTEIPADKSRWGSFDRLAEESRESVKAIIDELAATDDLPDGSDSQKVRDLYLSYMDDATINKLGAAPLAPLLAEIDELNSLESAVAQFAALGRRSISSPLVFWVGQDAKQPDTYIVQFTQSGLGLPDRDYYFDESERSETIRREYESYLGKLFSLAGLSDPGDRAQRVIALERALAEHHWTRVQNRDRNATYNKLDRAALNKLAPAFAWGRFLDSSGIGEQSEFIVRQPSYLEGMNSVLSSADLEDVKDYLRARLISTAADYLGDEFVAADFDFYGKVLRGREQLEERWKRGVNTVNGTVGQLVGKEYVKRHFPPAAKERMLVLVDNLKKAMAVSIDELEWMTEATKKEAHAKLASFNTKIGYPDKWDDFSALHIASDDLFGNMLRAAEFEHNEQVAKLGQSIDRDEWFMNPQTVNAYYSPTMNEIVFPAAILQPPFFYLEADDAMNYGGIGMVIGHEIGHGFDDQGRKSDGNGVLRDWWTEADAAEYTKRADQLVAQYEAFQPLEGQRINGRLTLGENIGDLGGLTLAWRAYQMSKNGDKPEPIDGYSGDQRFFLNYAQIWRSKIRDQALEQRLKTDSHSPPEYRVIGPLPNFTPFYETFGVEEGDKMYMPEAQRVSIW